MIKDGFLINFKMMVLCSQIIELFCFVQQVRTFKPHLWVVCQRKVRLGGTLALKVGRNQLFFFSFLSLDVPLRRITERDIPLLVWMMRAQDVFHPPSCFIPLTCLANSYSAFIDFLHLCFPCGFEFCVLFLWMKFEFLPKRILIINTPTWVSTEAIVGIISENESCSTFVNVFFFGFRRLYWPETSRKQGIRGEWIWDRP